MDTEAPKWPTHEDGSPKTMGELSKEQQREQWQWAAKRVQAHFDKPEVKAAIARLLES